MFFTTVRSCLDTIFSGILAIKGSLEIGWQLSRRRDAWLDTSSFKVIWDTTRRQRTIQNRKQKCKSFCPVTNSEDSLFFHYTSFSNMNMAYNVYGTITVFVVDVQMTYRGREKSGFKKMAHLTCISQWTFLRASKTKTSLLQRRLSKNLLERWETNTDKQVFYPKWYNSIWQKSYRAFFNRAGEHTTLLPNHFQYAEFAASSIVLGLEMQDCFCWLWLCQFKVCIWGESTDWLMAAGKRCAELFKKFYIAVIVTVLDTCSITLSH